VSQPPLRSAQTSASHLLQSSNCDQPFPLLSFAPQATIVMTRHNRWCLLPLSRNGTKGVAIAIWQGCLHLRTNTSAVPNTP